MSVGFRRAKSRFSYNVRNIKLGRYFFLIFLMVMLLIFAELYNNSFKPVLKELSETKANYLGIIAINESVEDVLNKSDITYDKLVTFMKNNSGEITGLMTNLITINRLKSEIILKVNEKISSIKEVEIFIPLGNITGVELFSGLGPKINIHLVPASKTTADFKNTFTDAGINQTRHQISLVISSSISILMPNNITSTTEVSSTIPIAESIIVGKVPESFTNVETKDETLREDILNLY